MDTPAPISLLLVDDSQPFRQGLRTLLDFYNASASPPVVVVGEAVTAPQAIKLAQTQRPNLMLLDMELAQGDGLGVLGHLRELPQAPRVLVLSVHREDEWVFRAMQAGAQGYVCKDRVADQLITAMTTVLRGEVYLSPQLAASFFRLFRFYGGQPRHSDHTVHLTDREQEVLHWLVQGASNDAIARHLHVTVATVKAHLTGIFEKLSVTSRTQAIVKALKLGLVSA
ncbi:MAG: response regulator transcription factor [Leptolyngbya sp.]|nr:response regulator transcription factor [Leptolyngbya sp.]